MQADVFSVSLINLQIYLYAFEGTAHHRCFNLFNYLPLEYSNFSSVILACISLLTADLHCPHPAQRKHADQSKVTRYTEWYIGEALCITIQSIFVVMPVSMRIVGVGGLNSPIIFQTPLDVHAESSWGSTKAPLLRRLIIACAGQ